MKPIKKNEMKLNKTYCAIDDRPNSMAIGYVNPTDDSNLTITVLDSIEKRDFGYESIPVTGRSIAGINTHKLSDNVQFFELSKDEELLHIVAGEL